MKRRLVRNVLRVGTQRAIAWLAGAATAVVGATLAGCASSPVAVEAPAARPVRASAPPALGDVVGRSDRLLVYVPRSGDTLRSIAARFLGSEDRDWVVADHNGISQPEPGVPLVVPLKTLNPIGVHADQYQTVPILCYHRFGAASGKMGMPAANFAQQLDWLARNDYRVVRLAELRDFLQGRQALPRRSVVITIDDGYESVYRVAFPLLKKYGFAATLFVYTDFVGAGDALDWSQLREMQASGLVDVQAHSKTHRNLIERALGESEEQYRTGLDNEIRLPRVLLEKRVPFAQVHHYAFPYGDANEAVLDALARSRYDLAVTVNPGGNAFFAQPLMLRRTMIYGDHDLESFKLKLQTSRSLGAP